MSSKNHLNYEKGLPWVIPGRGVLIEKPLRYAHSACCFNRIESTFQSGFTKVCHCVWFFYCGAGGIRTLVQTRNKQAFYMLILLLVFEQNKEISILSFVLAS